MRARTQDKVTLSSADPQKLLERGTHRIVCQDTELSLEAGGLRVADVLLSHKQIDSFDQAGFDEVMTFLMCFVQLDLTEGAQRHTCISRI